MGCRAWRGSCEDVCAVLLSREIWKKRVRLSGRKIHKVRGDIHGGSNGEVWKRPLERSEEGSATADEALLWRS